MQTYNNHDPKKNQQMPAKARGISKPQLLTPTIDVFTHYAGLAYGFNPLSTTLLTFPTL